MSTTIDQKVVEMRFDNRQFEKNVGTTMSTLDKLKQKLNLTGAAKGFDDIGRAAKKVDMSGLGRGVEQVGVKFNAMYTIADQALRNITTRVQHTAENMAKALTIDPIKTGFQEYETQINAVQTILANTSHNGTTIDDVNKALEELNKYADMTIYNFTEMTRNIGTFTAAGLDLDTSTKAIQGIANLAAVSGSTSQQASTAMYQLSQALAAGKVSLMDWNSVVNASMGGKVFQDAIMNTMKSIEGADKAVVKAYESGTNFRSLLNPKDYGDWFTSDILAKTLEKFTQTGAVEYLSELYNVSVDNVKKLQEVGEKAGFTSDEFKNMALSLAGGNESVAKDITDILTMANTATDAATKVKTFTQLWDVLKESAQSGWSQTWKLLVGDFEQAKSLLTPLSDILTGFINKMSEARNAVIESALGKSFKKLFENTKNILDPIKKSADGIKEVVDSVKDYANIVDDIIGGKWGTGQERWDKLAEAGYDWAHAQNLVNEKLGSSVRHATNYKEAQKGVAKSQEEVTASTNDYILRLAKMTDEQFAAENLSEEQVKAFKELAAAAEKTGIPLDEFIKNIDQIDGRYLMITGFKNAGDALLDTFKAIGKAWTQIFPPKSTEEKAQALFNILAAFHKFTRGMSEAIYVDGKFTETGIKLIQTFKGLFAILDIVTTLAGGGFKIAFKVLTSILGYFNLDILDLTANIGSAMVRFRNWVDSMFDVSKILDKIIPALTDGAKSFREWFNSLKEMDGIKNLITALERLFKGLKTLDLGGLSGIGKLAGGAFLKLADAIERITGIDITGIFNNIVEAFEKLTGIDLAPAGGFIFDGLLGELSSGAKKVIDFIAQSAADLINKFCDVLGIESPSKVFMALGGFIIAGLVMGIQEGFISVPDALQGVVDKALAVIKDIDWGTIFAIGTSIMGLVFIKKVGDAIVKVGDALEAFASPFQGLGNVFNATADTIKSFQNVTKAMATEIKTKALKNLAIALAILVACVVAIVVVAGDDYTKIAKAVVVIAALAVVLGVLAFAMNKMSTTSATFEKGKINFEGVKSGLLSIAAAVAILGVTVKLIGSMNMTQAIQGFIGLVGVMAVILGFVYILQKVTKGDVSENIDKVGGMMIKLGIAMLLMVYIAKLAGSLNRAEIEKGVGFAVVVGIFVGALTAIAKSAGNNVSKVGGLMLKLSIAMLLMVGICKLVSLLSPTEMFKGAIFAGAMILFVKSLVKATTIGKKQQIAKLGGLLLAISTSMLMLIGICKLVNKLSPEEMVKGGLFALAFVGLVAILVKVTTIADDKKIAKVGATILAFSVALGIMALVAMILSLLNVEALIKGVTAVSVLGLVMAVMVKSLGNIEGSEHVAKTLFNMILAISIMAIAVAALSLIDSKKLAVATGCMSLLMGAFATMIASVGKLKGVDKAAGTIIGMTVIVGVLAGILWAISKLDPQSALVNAGALSLLMTVFAASLFALSKAGTISKTVTKTMLPMLGVVVGLAAILAIFSLLDVNASLPNVLGLSTLMLAFSTSMAILGAAGKISTTVSKQLAPMLGVVAGLATILAILSLLNVQASLPTVLGLSVLMTAFSTSMVILSAAGRISTTVTKTMLPMLGVVAGLALILAILSCLNVAPSIETVASLSVMLLALSAAIVIISHVGPMIVMADAAMIAMAKLVAGLTIVLTALGALSKIPGFNDLIKDGGETLSLIGYALGNFVGSLVGGLAAGITSGLPEIGENLSGFMRNAGTFITGAEGISEKTVNGVKSLAAAIAVITAADLVAGWASFLSGGSVSFGQLGTDLSEFMKNALPFIIGTTLIKPQMIESARSLAEVILILTATDVVNGLSSKLFGENDFSMFGTQLTAFGEAMVKFSDAITSGNGINEVAIEAAAKAGALMVELQKTLPRSGGWLQEVMGEQDLLTFGTACVAFGKCMVRFSKEIITGGGVNEDAIKSAATAGSLMSELQNSLPRTGGWLQEICGEQDLLTFGTSCVAFAKCMTNFSQAVIEGGGVDANAAKQAVAAGEVMTAFQNTLPRTGGWIQEIAGEADIQAFGLSCKAFGDAMSAFGTSIQIDETAVTAAINAGTMMTELQKAIPEDKWFDGKVSLEDFGKKIVTFGEKMAAYSEEVSGIDAGIVSSSITSANRLVTLTKKLVDLDTSGIDDFKVKKIGTAMKDYNGQVKNIDASVVASSVNYALKLRSLITKLASLDTSGVSLFNPKPIGEKMKSYSASVSEVNISAINNSINAATKLKNFISSLAGLNASGVGVFKNAVENLGKIQVGNIEKTFSSAAANLTKIGGQLIEGMSKGMRSKQGALMNTSTSIAKALVTNARKPMDTFRTIGVAYMTKLANGISSHRRAAVTALSSAMGSAVSKARGYYTSFYNAGSYLVSGFASGISANAYKATAKARAMALAAKNAAEAALGIASPSKVFYKIGDYAGQGLVNALGDYNSKTYEAGSTMAEYAKRGLSNALSQIQDTIDSDLDTQPTIRPVLDLTNVRTGAAAIGGLFGNGVSVGTLASVNSIGSMMNSRIQNGTNDDVISAIDRLGASLANAGGDTYMIDGITYDDGSNISNAMRSIVREARIERRR